MSDILIRSVRNQVDLEAFRQLCRDAVAWEIDNYPDLRPAIIAHFQPDTLDERLALLPGPYARPTGDMFLARLDTRPVGTAMYKSDGNGLAEMNRLFVSPAARGRGAGAQLVDEVMTGARQDGSQTLRFVSARHLTSAIRLYRALGFQEVSPWREIDPATAKIILFMEREL